MMIKPVWTLALLAAVVTLVIYLYRRIDTLSLPGLPSDDDDDDSSPSNTVKNQGLEFRLSRNEDSSKNLLEFKIVQIADIHLGEAEDKDWGPEQDRKTWIVIDKVLSTENPDLIVLSGDQLTANNCDRNATAYYKLLGEKLSKYDTPWALIFGNHDDMALEIYGPNGTVTDRKPAKTSRRQLIESHQQFNLSLTKQGPEGVFGVSNYWLDISAPRSNDRDTEIAARVLMLDSGGGSLDEQIDQTQIDWFYKTTRPDIPVFAFQHIPASLDDFKFVEGKCVGDNRDNGPSPVTNDAGIVRALMDANNVHWLAVGHNHGNDYCCQRSEILHVCFGRHSGYGGYGTWERGARIFMIEIDQNNSTSVNWSSWVSLESGEIVDRYSSS